MEHTAPDDTNLPVLVKVMICICICVLHVGNLHTENIAENMANVFDTSHGNHTENHMVECKTEVDESFAITYLPAPIHSACHEPSYGPEHAVPVCGVPVGTVGVARSNSGCILEEVVITPHDRSAEDPGI